MGDLGPTGSPMKLLAFPGTPWIPGYPWEPMGPQGCPSGALVFN